jgi:hypothetical protein
MFADNFLLINIYVLHAHVHEENFGCNFFSYARYKVLPSVLHFIYICHIFYAYNIKSK